VRSCSQTIKSFRLLIVNMSEFIENTRHEACFPAETVLDTFFTKFYEDALCYDFFTSKGLSKKEKSVMEPLKQGDYSIKKSKKL